MNPNAMVYGSSTTGHDQLTTWVSLSAMNRICNNVQNPAPLDLT